MARIAGVLLATLLAGVLLALPPAGAQAQDGALPDADELMRRVDEMWRGESSRARMTMIVRTQHYERRMTMEAWSQGEEKSLVTIVAPKKDAGISTLKVSENIWNYLPRINRVTKIPPSMMMGSWMGSHFTNDDLVKESQYEEDYDGEITFHGTRDGQRIYEVTLIPRPDAVVVWGKVVMEIEAERLLPLQAGYYDEEGLLVRTLRFAEPRTFDGRTVMSRLRLEPEDKPDEHTTIVYEEIEFGVELPPDVFSLRRLRGM